MPSPTCSMDLPFVLLLLSFLPPASGVRSHLRTTKPFSLTGWGRSRFTVVHMASNRHKLLCLASSQPETFGPACVIPPGPRSAPLGRCRCAVGGDLPQDTPRSSPTSLRESKGLGSLSCLSAERSVVSGPELSVFKLPPLSGIRLRGWEIVGAGSLLWVGQQKGAHMGDSRAQHPLDTESPPQHIPMRPPSLDLLTEGKPRAQYPRQYLEPWK